MRNLFWKIDFPKKLFRIIVKHRKLKIIFSFPVVIIGNQSMRINILVSYMIMDRRGKGGPMNHQ